VLALQMRYSEAVKTATLPAVRVDPRLRDEAEALLAEGETLSQFVEAAVRAGVERRRFQAEFVARGLASLASARESGQYVDADEMLQKLSTQVTTAKAAAKAALKADALARQPRSTRGGR
jgi:predicted transcriptional regulator